MRAPWRLALFCGLMLAAELAWAQPQTTPEPATEKDDAAPAPAEPGLPAGHEPRVSVQVTPKSGASVGDPIKLVVRADALVGDDVAVPEQSFAPFEITGKRLRVEPEHAGRQTFVFELDLLALDAGEQTIPAIDLRVVTKEGFVGSLKTSSIALKVSSLLGNEPNAQLKGETKPVVVMQQDYTLLYVLGGIAAAALIALLTWLVARYVQRRVKPAPPPPPPRPPWEVAVEKLAELRRRKQGMVEAGEAAQFVDEVSDVTREYLGARFGFDGLESTTDEALALLRDHGCNAGLWQEVAAYLRRCDLIKFARVDPDQDEADLVFAKAQDIVQFSTPLDEAYGGEAAPAREGDASRQADEGENGAVPNGPRSP
jgi:hypothetical protein